MHFQTILSGVLFLSCVSAAAGEEDCWWTGCQPLSWGVRGCDQYDRVEAEKRGCTEGHEFRCCTKDSVVPITTPTPKPTEIDNSCWWTGCQPLSWGVRGCDQYDRQEDGKRSCKDGDEFYCCPKRPTTEKPKQNSCWWTGCQSDSWAVKGCEQYQKFEVNKKNCDGGWEYYCCDEVPNSSSGENGEKVCWWSTCTASNTTSSAICPNGLRTTSTEDCGNGEKIFECCGTEGDNGRDTNKLTGDSFEELVKYLFLKHEGFSAKPDFLKCESVDPGKKHMLKVKEEAIRICDMCPNLPQKYLANVLLDRVPFNTQPNFKFEECFGLCYEDKKCMALSYERTSATCYVFDSTAGGFVEEDGWSTVLMTQPSGVVQGFSYTRHTRLLGRPQHSSIQPNFLSCVQDCTNKEDCNYLNYFALLKNCSLYQHSSQLTYVDFVYGHLSAIRVSHQMSSQPIEDRFVPEGEELSVAPASPPEDKKCGHFRNSTHGAVYSQSCLVSADIIGCDQKTGCKRCYYPEKQDTDVSINLPICADSEPERIREVKSNIIGKMKLCFADVTCVGVGYDKSADQVATMTLKDYIQGQYNIKYVLKIPPNDSRKYLGEFDLVAKAEIRSLPNSRDAFKEVSGVSFGNCVKVFSIDKSYSVMSYSHSSRVCKLGNEWISFTRAEKSDSVALFKPPSLMSSTLNYLRTPGFKITSTPKATFDGCTADCVNTCTRKCSVDHVEWCVYVSIEYGSNSGRCSFYDDDHEFSFQAQENSIILTLTSSLDFTLESFDKLSQFQGTDVFNCFAENNEQTQTSLANYQKWNSTSIQSFRSKRGIGDFFKKIGKSIVDGVKSVGRAVVNTAKGVVNTVGNLVKGDIKAAGESFKKIPVVELAKNTVELGGAVFTGDWDKAKKKGKEIIESDAFELVTTVALPGAGKVITTGVKAGIKGLAKAGKKGAKDIVKGGKNKVDDVAKDSRNVKNGKKDGDRNDKKKDKEVEKERGEKCDNKKRGKRSNPPAKVQKTNPGSCKNQNKNAKCSKPKRVTYVITSTLNECDNAKPGDKCSYECKPGYHEENPTATCSRVQNDAIWQPKPKCTAETCPAGANPLIVLETPQAEAFGPTALGKYITAYVVLFDKSRRLPIWSVALHQSSQFDSKNYNSAKTVKRNQGWAQYPCKELKPYQATNGDYSGSGWHKGHLTPANVARWSQKSKRLSNLYINAAPQDGHSNSGPWNLLEAHVYCFSKRFRSVVATGVCSDSLPGRKVGKLPIPKCFWKMVCYRDENSNYQVVGFYSGNSPVSGKTQEKARAQEIFTPLSQNELNSKISGGFNLVWERSARHLNMGRPVPVGDGVWTPINTVQCGQADALSSDEKTAWRDAFEGSMNELKRGKNTKDDGDDGDDSDSDSDDRRRRKRATKIQRGCHGSDLKTALDETGFFLPYSEGKDESDDEADENDDKDEGDGSVKVSVQNCGKRIVGYYTSWGEKTIAGLELQRLTHVIYAFLEMHSDGTISVGSADRKNAEDVGKETRKAQKRLEDLLESAKRYSHLKIMFAVGGWENSQYFSAVAASPDLRVKFIASVIKMIEKFGFDGVDVDWEYPVTGGADEGVPADKQNYVILMKELRIALDGLAAQAGRKEKFLISFAGAAGQWTLDPGYDLPGLFKYADFVNIMTYDYFGAWASKWGAYTGPPSPLYFGMPPGFSGKTNTDWSVKYYTCKTKQPHKINMGVPFYGRYWKNVGASVDGKDEMWRTASSVIGGKFEGGYVPWHKVKSDYLNNGAFEKKFHEKAKAPYAWNPAEKIFLGYENKESLEHKVKYAVEKNVGGLMIWALELDDDSLTLLNTVAKAPLCTRTDPSDVNHKCSPIDEKRWWTPEDGEDKAGLCGRSAPLYKGYYPVCDPDDPGYSCCGAAGYCGFGPKYCDCPTCKNFREDPKTILKEPIKPSIPVTWYLLNDPDGKRGRCGRKVPKINSVFPTCNPDDDNSYCCSNGGYCGNSDAHCKCNGCVDFKKDPKYQYGPKKWWTLEDGKDLGGQCGPKAPKVDGKYEAECEGSSNFHCCSPTGWCGSGADFCDCKGCKDFKGKN